ncbi:MAG: hypothetical protein H0W64_00725 [Gammaproteobacteria bacterium]|nr:hypothetical protein [Gammaproteobacteria bacterium]
MKANEKIKKCVAFLQLKQADDRFELPELVFFVFFEINKTKYTYVVTANMFPKYFETINDGFLR